jgi:hypothetical protein
MKLKVKYTVELQAVGCEICGTPLPEAGQPRATSSWRLLEFKNGIRNEGDELYDFCSLKCLNEWLRLNKAPV